MFLTSFVEPWHFGMDLYQDAGIHITNLRIRLRILLFLSGACKMPTKNKFYFWVIKSYKDVTKQYKKFKSKPLILLSGEHFFQNLEEPNFFMPFEKPYLRHYTAVTSTYVVLYTNKYIVFCKNEICKFFNSQIGRHARYPSALDDIY